MRRRAPIAVAEFILGMLGMYISAWVNGYRRVTNRGSAATFGHVNDAWVRPA
jgi:hypothetical protein